jgi:CheY-like chemotaxis protein
MATIVIAEDEFLLADMLQFMLEDAGYQVFTAPHGVAALALVRENKIDLVITDFMMPLMTGLELAQALRKEPRYSRLPIILVSGAQGAIGRAHPDVFDAVLDKPYHVDTLLRTVSDLLQRG